ncbi:MAG: hypothetical protein CENE_03022 [Candidatus Celerinatantimonas neptuna]|nr:MAG: hypothetical protein CENE_03022 [Candidatus Celerinatantimonas neptuna]
MKYFELNDDINFPNRWYLGDILGVDNWELSTSVPEGIASLEIKLVHDGDEMDFTYTEAYGVPVISRKVKEVLDDIKGIDFIPVKIQSKRCLTDYFVLIVSELIECVDEKCSEFQKFELNDPVRPDKAGEYRAFMKLRLDTSNINGIEIFRVKKFEISIIISERVKERLKAIAVKGLDLISVV